VSTFHPVNLATTVVPVAKGFTATKTVVNAAEKGVARACSTPPLRMCPLESRL